VRVSTRNVGAYAFWARANATAMARPVDAVTLGDWHRFSFTPASPL
jgi:hypothetical protein